MSPVYPYIKLLYKVKSISSLLYNEDQNHSVAIVSPLQSWKVDNEEMHYIFQLHFILHLRRDIFSSIHTTQLPDFQDKDYLSSVPVTKSRARPPYSELFKELHSLLDLLVPGYSFEKKKKRTELTFYSL